MNITPVNIRTDISKLLSHLGSVVEKDACFETFMKRFLFSQESLSYQIWATKTGKNMF